MDKTKSLVQRTESRLRQAHKVMTMRQCDLCFKGDMFQEPWDEVNNSGGRGEALTEGIILARHEGRKPYAEETVSAQR